MQVDPQFRAARQRARNRRLRRAGLRAVLFGLLPLCALTLSAWLFTDLPQRVAAWQVGRDDDEVLVQIESDITVAPVVRGDVFLDIPGDPTLLRLPPEDVGERVVRTAGPGVLDIARFGLPAPDRIAVLRDDLVVTESRLITTVPSSREDFAFLQAQQDRAMQEMRDAMADPAALAALAGIDVSTPGELSDDSDGIAIAGLAPGDRVAPAVATPVEETSLTFTRPENLRAPLYEDVILRVERSRTLGALLAETSDIREAEGLTDAILAALPEAETLRRGSIVALRLRGGVSVAQVTLYGPEGHLGSVALQGGRAIAAADPWLNDDLLGLAGPMDDDPGTFRLLDAIYSAALRAGLPAPVAGTFTGVLSKDLDLEQPARDGDRITLAYAEDHGPGGNAEGQLMYAALEGPSGNWRCYVVPDANDNGFRCHIPGRRSGGGGAALVSPVDGVMTSKYGPRKHPILGVVRLHAGVDWAAPTGTPVRAAAAGKVARMGVAGGYGNLVTLTHPGGMETRYAHLHRFARGLKVGDVVQAGQVIGEVGTTGRSTGPHLHFETRLAGKPTDPLPLLTGPLLVAESDAVEALVSQIIQVESAGNARAKNPLSTATGLGQFIESTWLRMMRTYRPELAASMSRADLLALRFDPTLSREMVTRLAQENEAFLRARGHQITAGRLYLAHFLGPGGANTVLSASEEQTIRALMGNAVVRANPFLARYDVSDLKAWADRKMRGRGRAVAAAPPPPPEPLSREVEVYIDIVDALVRQAG